MLASYTAQDIFKTYGGRDVLAGVGFSVQPGEVHGLLGHNGAGKSTLLKILAGVERPDKGTLQFGDHALELKSPSDALGAGIACVFQELRLIPLLDVTANIFLGREMRKGLLCDRRSMVRHARALLESLDLRIDPEALVRDLSHPEKQLVEVVASIDRNARFLLLDEPTTALEGEQAEALLKKIRSIADQQRVGIVYVSHKLDEVLAICDRITVLAEGKTLLHVRKPDTSKAEIVRAIAGDHPAHTWSEIGPIKARQLAGGLKVEGLGGARLSKVDLEAHRGEVLGLYGLMGSGRTRFCRTIYGLEEVQRGQIVFDDRPLQVSSPADALSKSVAYLTEERKRDGLIFSMSGAKNVVLSTLTHFRSFGIVDYKAARSRANQVLRHLRGRGDLDGPVGSLSGGNQQKVLLARILEQNADLILLDEPTKGVDVGAREDIHHTIREIAATGKCVVVVSSEEEEILSVCDRVAVFQAGHCDGSTVPTSELTISRLRHLAWAA